jgi:hypothetical protein
MIASRSPQGKTLRADIVKRDVERFLPDGCDEELFKPEAVAGGGVCDVVQLAAPLIASCIPQGATQCADMDSNEDERFVSEAVAAVGACDVVPPFASLIASCSPQGNTQLADMDSSDDEEFMPKPVAADGACDVVQPFASLVASRSPQGKMRWADMDSSDDEEFTLEATAAAAPQNHERLPSRNDEDLIEVAKANVVHDKSSLEALSDPHTRLPPTAQKSPTGSREIISLPAGFASTLIGRNGDTVRLMQDRTGARIFVDRENNYARITGKPETVTSAAAQIQELMLAAAEHLEQSAEGDVIKEALMLPDGFGSTLIGPCGTTVNRLQEQTGARIWVEKDCNRARVMGKPEQVSAALHLIQELIAQTGGVKAPCKWYTQGRCRRGAACGFSHTVPTHPKGTKKAFQSN